MLVTMWDYRKKQKKKVTLLLSLETAADDGTEARVRPEEDQEPAQPWNESIEMSGMSTSSKTRTVCLVCEITVCHGMHFLYADTKEEAVGCTDVRPGAVTGSSAGCSSSGPSVVC
jgi:hypothetical protein